MAYSTASQTSRVNPYQDRGAASLIFDWFLEIKERLEWDPPKAPALYAGVRGKTPLSLADLSEPPGPHCSSKKLSACLSLWEWDLHSRTRPPLKC